MKCTRRPPALPSSWSTFRDRRQTIWTSRTTSLTSLCRGASVCAGARSRSAWPRRCRHHARDLAVMVGVEAAAAAAHLQTDRVYPHLWPIVVDRPLNQGLGSPSFAREKAEWLRYSATTAMLARRRPKSLNIMTNWQKSPRKSVQSRVADSTKLTAGVGCRTFCREDLWSSNERRFQWWLSIDRYSSIDTADPARNLLR